MKNEKWLKIIYRVSLLVLPPTALYSLYLIYTYHRTNGLPNSSIFFEWDTFGTLLSGVSAPTAALLTFVSFIYLVTYNSETQEEQKKFFIEQQAYWKDQQALIALERAHKHKTIFLEKIEAIEKRCHHLFSISDHDALYSYIFPQNTLTHVDLKTKLSGSNLEQAIRNYHQLYNYISNLANHNDISSINIHPSKENIAITNTIIRLVTTINKQLLITPNAQNAKSQLFQNMEQLGFDPFLIITYVDHIRIYLNELIRFTDKDNSAQLPSLEPTIWNSRFFPFFFLQELPKQHSYEYWVTTNPLFPLDILIDFLIKNKETENMPPYLIYLITDLLCERYANVKDRDSTIRELEHFLTELQKYIRIETKLPADFQHSLDCLKSDIENFKNDLTTEKFKTAS